jgi:fumarylacetoacetase
MGAVADSELRSFLPIPPESEFPIQNLPFGVFVPEAGAAPRVGVAIGEWILDLALLAERGLFCGPELAGLRVFEAASLNPLLALGPAAWREARGTVARLLRADVPTLRDDAALRDLALVSRAEAEMCLPCVVGDYTDFYAGRQHAENVGRMFRGPDAALPPNYLHLPIGYHGRASSLVVSGTEIRRPRGQYRAPEAGGPSFGPSRELDFELELGFFIGRGNSLGSPIPIGRAPNQIFGYVLVNDWSARDIQQWEYAPLGPFLGKSFATTVSPWVVTTDALAPFRCTGPVQEPPPLDYLRLPPGGPWAYDMKLEVALRTPEMQEPVVIARTNFRELYWLPVQMVAHHTVNGCNLRPGDLLATGTISGPTADACGSLLEATLRGQRPLALPGGQTRAFLEDGDEVTLAATCDGPGYRVGFGACTGRILPG